MSGTQPRGRLNTITNSDSVHEGYAKIKSRTNNKWKTRYVTLIKGISKKPCILLMFKNSDKEKLKTYTEVHSVSVKSNADDIRVDDVGSHILIHVDTAKAHIKWIVALKFAITGRVHIPVKHHGLDDDEYSLLHVEESKYSDHTLHHLIVLHSPYDNTEVRHCWDSLEIKQLRAVQEGILLEFCPHCSKSINFVRLGFTLRLPQNEIETCLEYFCQHTTAKYKKDEAYICEMICHYNMCSYSPPLHAPPNPPPVPTNMHLTLYNVSNVLFQDKKPSRSRASKSKLEATVAPILSSPQRDLQYVNQDSVHQPYTITQETSSSSAMPRRDLHYVNQDSANHTSTTTQGTSSSSVISSQPQLSGSHVSNRPPIAPRRFPGNHLQRVQPELQQDTTNQLKRQKSSGTWPRERPIPKPRGGPIVEHIYDEIDSPSQQHSYGDEKHHAGVPQSNSATTINVGGNEESSSYYNVKRKSAAKQTSYPLETAHSQPTIQASASYVDELKNKLTSGSPDVVSIPLTESKVVPKSISIYRKQVMDKKPSYSDTTSGSATLSVQKTSSGTSEKFKEMHNVLQRTLFYQRM